MQPSLKHLAKFEKILADYQPSSEALDILSQIPLAILLGISGAGRNTIINRLVNDGGYHYVVSDTTRPPKLRDGQMEQDGINYYFRSEEDFLKELEEGKYLEAEVIHNQQVSGISVRELQQAKTSGKIPINEVDIAGTVNIRAAKPDTKFFFVVPPSYKEWMRRLLGREIMSEEERANRINTAIKVLETGLGNDHFIFVINDSSEKSAEMIDRIMRGEIDDEHHAEAVAAAKSILEDIRRHHG